MPHSPVTRSDILFDARWKGPHGIGRWAEEIHARIPELVPLHPRVQLFNPLDPLVLAAQLKLRPPAVYFTPGFNPPLFESVPLVVTVHDLNYVHFEQNSDPLRRAYFRHLVRPACRRAHRVLTVSEYSRRQIIDWANVSADRVSVVGAGVGKQFSVHGQRYALDRPYVLAVGNERPHKNIPGLIRAYAASGLRNEVKLLITGRISTESTSLIEDHRLRDSVVLAGIVPEAELPSVYRGALMLCMPSFYEGFGLPIVEAMACGVPVLASSVTSIPEIAADAALLIDPADIEQIADGLKRLVADDALRRELITRGARRAQDFDWAAVAAKTGAIVFSARESRVS